MVPPESARLNRMIRYVGCPLVLLVVWDIAVTLGYVYSLDLFIQLPALPMTLLGSALALLVGFRDNNAYQRWWERTLSGAPWSTLRAPSGDAPST